MTTGQDDADLLARVVEGDHDAFATLMRKHEDRVFAVCLRIMGSRAAAFDATQETFLTLYRKANQYRATAAVGTWLYRIAVNTCYDQIRKSGRRPTDSLPDHLEPPDLGAEDAIEAAGLRPEIERALASLPPEFRAAVVLSDLEGMPLPEVAQALGVPLGTVKSRVFRGRRLLAERLGNQTAS